MIRIEPDQTIDQIRRGDAAWFERWWRHERDLVQILLEPAELILREDRLHLRQQCLSRRQSLVADGFVVRDHCRAGVETLLHAAEGQVIDEPFRAATGTASWRTT